MFCEHCQVEAGILKGASTYLSKRLKPPSRIGYQCLLNTNAYFKEGINTSSAS